MSDQMNDGGLAFPGSRMEPNPLRDHVLESMVRVDYPGMSLRDYFAAKAMAAYITGLGNQLNDENLATWAYTTADAMLKARTGQSRETR